MNKALGPLLQPLDHNTQAVSKKRFGINMVLVDRRNGKMACLYRAHGVKLVEAASSTPNHRELSTREDRYLSQSYRLNVNFTRADFVWGLGLEVRRVDGSKIPWDQLQPALDALEWV